MALTCPVDGFDYFKTYRAAGSDEVEIILQEEDSYVFTDLDELKLWLRRVGMHQPFIERFVDLIWNWRVLRFDLRTQHLRIPDVQVHPIQDTSPVHVPFRAPRQQDLVDDCGNGCSVPTTPKDGRDIFDPLQDTQTWSSQ